MPEKRKSHVKSGALVMRSIALVIALVAVLIAPAFAQKTEIEAVNAK
jgi:membrane protein involved in colicin uptake